MKTLDELTLTERTAVRNLLNAAEVMITKGEAELASAMSHIQLMQSLLFDTGVAEVFETAYDDKMSIASMKLTDRLIQMKENIAELSEQLFKLEEQNELE